jgi:hypothetical protein
MNRKILLLILLLAVAALAAGLLFARPPGCRAERREE